MTLTREEKTHCECLHLVLFSPGTVYVQRLTSVQLQSLLVARKTLATPLIRVKSTGRFGCKEHIHLLNISTFFFVILEHKLVSLLTSLIMYFSKFLIVCPFRVPYTDTVQQLKTRCDSPCQQWDTILHLLIVNLIHRVVNEVHGVSNILEHASVGHEQIAVLETFQDPGRILTAEREW